MFKKFNVFLDPTVSQDWVPSNDVWADVEFLFLFNKMGEFNSITCSVCPEVLK